MRVVTRNSLDTRSRGVRDREVGRDQTVIDFGEGLELGEESN